MTKLTAVAFKNQAQLKQEIAGLSQLEEKEYAIVAQFQAQAPNGEMYELSCFVERQGSIFNVAGLVEANQDVDTSMLEFELLHHTAC